MDDLGQQLQHGASSSSDGEVGGLAGVGMPDVTCGILVQLCVLGSLPDAATQASGATYRTAPPLAARPLPRSRAELYRAASFNTKVGVLRSQSPFYRMQDAPGSAAGPSSASARPGPAAAAAASSTAAASSAAAAAAEGIELKPASANVLLGQAHLEGRGKFLPAHPVPHHSPGAAMRRGPSPLQRAASPDAG